MSISIQQALDAKAKYAQMLMEVPGVIGVGVGKVDSGNFCVVIYTTGTDDLPGRPRQLDGVPVRLDVSGAVHATGGNFFIGPTNGKILGV